MQFLPSRSAPPPPLKHTLSTLRYGLDGILQFSDKVSANIGSNDIFRTAHKGLKLRQFCVGQRDHGQAGILQRGNVIFLLSRCFFALELHTGADSIHHNLLILSRKAVEPCGVAGGHAYLEDVIGKIADMVTSVELVASYSANPTGDGRISIRAAG